MGSSDFASKDRASHAVRPEEPVRRKPRHRSPGQVEAARAASDGARDEVLGRSEAPTVRRNVLTDLFGGKKRRRQQEMASAHARNMRGVKERDELARTPAGQESLDKQEFEASKSKWDLSGYEDSAQAAEFKKRQWAWRGAQPSGS